MDWAVYAVVTYRNPAGSSRPETIQIQVLNEVQEAVRMATWWRIISAYSILAGPVLYLQDPDRVLPVLMVLFGIIGFLLYPCFNDDKQQSSSEADRRKELEETP